MKNSRIKKASGSKKVAVEMGLTVIAAAALGAYLLSGSKNAARNRKRVKQWSEEAKGEIIKRLRSLPKLDEKTYRRVVREVSDKYEKLGNLDMKEVAEFVGDLHGRWKIIEKMIRPKSLKAPTAGSVVKNMTRRKTQKKA